MADSANTPPNETPEKKSDEKKSGLDLAGLSSLNFGPNWASKEGTSGSSDTVRRYAERDNAGSRDRRPAASRDRRPPRPRRDAEGSGGGAGGRPESSAPGDDRRGRGPQRGFDRGDARQAPPPFRPACEVNFYPQDEAFDALIKRLGESCRTYQLFEIANVILQKPERLVAVIGSLPPREAGQELEPVYFSVPDHVPFLSEEEAVAHVLKNHLERFFTDEIVEVEPPKGNFVVVNRCGYTGELLGPPNHHRYAAFVQEHFQKSIHNLSFERFQSKIETVKDPEVVAAWLEKMKQGKRYTEILPEAEAAETEEAATAAAPDTAEPEAKAETAAEATPATEATSEAPQQEPDTAPADAAEATPSESAAEASPADAPEAPEAPAPVETREPRVFENLEAVTHYLMNERKRDVVGSVELVRFPGKQFDLIPDGPLKRTILWTYERQKVFPLDTANNIRGRLRRERFSIYKKGSKGISFVCAVKRKFRDPATVFSDSIAQLIEFVEKHPKVKVSELREKFLGITPPAKAPEPAEAPAGEAPSTPPAEGEKAPPPAAPAEPSPAELQLARDLRWLITEGYVAEYSDGTLFAHAIKVQGGGKASKDTDGDDDSGDDDNDSGEDHSGDEDDSAEETKTAPA